MDSEAQLKEALTEQLGRNVKEYYQDDTAYVVLQRSILEDLPEEIQRRFIGIIEEIESIYDMADVPKKYVVLARGPNGNSKGGTCHIKDAFKSKTPPKFRK